MRFVPVTSAKQFALAEKIIAPYEKYCVSLADRVRLRDGSVFLLSHAKQQSPARFFPSNFFLPKSHEALCACGVIFCRNTLFHCLPFMYDRKNDGQNEAIYLDLVRSLPSFLRGQKITCISGTKNESLLFIRALSQEPAQTYDYTLMSFAPGNFLARQKSGRENPRASSKASRVRIGLATAAEAEAIFGLHAGYLREEVLPPCRTLSLAAARQELEKLLATRLEFFAQNEAGRAVAKGGIHAEGQACAQIGGIYTLPEERGKQHAQKIVRATVAEILRQKKQPVLFVKKQNQPALAVYKKIGFVPEADYLIAYY